MRSAAQMFHAYTRAPWTSKTSSIATRKRMANKHHCRNWHRQVIFLHTPWLQGTCNHMQGCAGSLAGSVNRAGGAARWKGRAPVIVAVAVDGPARTTPLVHVAPCTPRSHSTAPRQAAQPAPGLHSSGQARERPCNALHGHCGRRRRPMPCLACSGRACGRAGGLQQRTKGRRHRCIRTWCRPRRWAHRQPGPRACRAADRAAGTRRGPTVTPPARPRERLQDSAG